MRLIGEEEAKRRGLDRLFYGSDPMVMEEPASITPGEGVRDREKALRAAFDAAAASGVTPERASEDLRLSRSTGIPFGMISESDRMRNSALLDEHRRACRESFARAAREAPTASRFLSKPENMLFARNDAGALTETERWFEVPLRSLKANSLETRINALYGEAVLSGMNESIENEIAKLTAERQALGEIPEGAVNNYLWNAFSMFPQLWEQGKRGVETGLLWGAGGALGAALLGQAGPQAALPEEVLTVPAAFGIMGTQGVFYGMTEKGFYIEAGAAYNEYRQIPNVDDDSARLMAFLTGGVNALIERASLGTLAKTFPGGSAAVQRMLGRRAIREALSNPTTRKAIAEFAKTYAKGISIDTVQEVTQEFMNIVGGDILKSQAGEPTSSVEDIAARLSETAVQSVMAESLIYLPGPALGLRNNLRRARSASVTAESFAKAAEVMDSTEVKNLAPSVAEQYVREAIAGTGKETSYIPASKVVELYQSSDLEELRDTFPEVLGVTEAESIKAMEEGIDIEIDSAKLLNADKSLRDAVLPFVSFEPEGMSQAEAERLAKWSEKSMEKGVEAANFEMERERRYIESARKVAESKRMELEAVGRDPETAAAEAELVGNMYVTLARRWNEAMPRKDGREYLPEDIAKMYPISLTRSEDGSGRVTGLTMNQAAIEDIDRAYGANAVKKTSSLNHRPPVSIEPMNGQQLDIDTDILGDTADSVNITADPKSAELYDVLPEDKNARLSASPENRFTDLPGGARLSAAPDNGLADLPGLSSITIKEMLSGVKDFAGEDYFPVSEMSEDTKKAMPDRVFNSFDAAKAYLKEQIKKAEKGVENESGGIAVSLAANGIKKMLSIKATEKSQANGFSIRDHITAAANILKLYNNSELLFTHSDKKHRANVTQIKRFGAPVVVPDSRDAAIAYITVREIRGQDNKLYSVELVSFELLKAEKMPPGTFGLPLPSEEIEPPTGGLFNVSESAENVNAEAAEAEKMPPGNFHPSLRSSEESDWPAGGDLTVTEGGENVNTEVAGAEKMPPGNFRTSLTEEEIAQPAGGDLTVAEGGENVNTEEAVSGEAASDGFARLAEKYEKVNEELNRLYQKASANVRGSISLPRRRGQPVRITFSPSANRSTFMHEMAHFYLYQLRQMEAVNDGGNYTAWNYSPPSWINDLRIISSWWNENAGAICEWIKKEDFSDEVMDGAGAEAFQSWLVSGMETDSEIGRAFDRSAHEYFARGFERYLEEGRAPTAALQKVFRRFKRWLAEIYRDFVGLNVELSDDVRGVFDRMVATEDAIEVFRAERDIEAAFGRDVTEEEALNISPFSDEDEFAEADERLLSRLLDEVSPEARKRMTDYAEEIRPGIVRAVASSRPYRVLSILENAPEMRINERSFVDAVGDTAAASVPDGLLTKEGGLDLGYGLKNLEYSSVDEFISDFSGLSDFKTAVDERVYNEVARRFVSAASSEDGMREAVNRAWYEGTEHAERIAAEASIDDFADIYAADEAARAAAESPTNRAKVAKFVEEHGFIKYESVVQEFGREQAQALHKRAPFLFRKKGLSMGELAQNMREEGIPIETNEHLFDILLGENPPRSPIDTARKEGFLEGYAKGRAFVKYPYAKNEAEAQTRRRALDRALKDSVGKDKAKQKMESAKMAAENIVRTMTVEELRKVVPFVRAEKNARMNAESALRRGDEAAFRGWKEKELLNNSVVRQMYKSQREAEVIRTWLERYKNRTQKQTFGMDVKFLKQVDAMLSRIGLRRMRGLTEAQRKVTTDAEPLTKFIKDMAEEGTPIMVPDWITESSVERHYSQFMLWQLKDIQNVVKNIVTAGRQEKRLISLAQNIAFSDAEDEIIAGAKKFYGDRVSGESSRIRVENADKESRFKLAKDYYDDLFTPEAICRTIDGYTDNGAMQRYVFRPVREGQSRVCLELNEIFAKFRKLKEDCYGDKKFSNDKSELDVPVYERLADKERPGRYVYIPTKEKQRFTRENLVCFGLNLGNEGNIARLKNSGFTDRDINFIKNELTAEDWKYIQGVWDLLETMWPKIQKVHELMTGTTAEPVKAQPVVTKYGKLRGGYYPIVTDLRYSLSAAAQKEQREVMTSAPMGFGIAQTESGHRKARAENVEGRPLLFELSVLDNHVANVVYDYEMTPVIRDVRKLLKRDRIQRLIADVLGEHQARNLNKWLNDVAANTKNNGLSMDTKDRLVNKAISGTAMFSLGANVGGALMQPLGYFPLAHKIGGVNAALAVLKGLRHPEETWRLAHEKSAFMREQMDGTNAEVRNLRQNWSSQGKKLNAVQDRMLSIYPFFQNMCSVPAWCQSYYVGMKKFNGDEKEAIAYADAVIRQTQGASGIADLSTFERGGVVARFFSMFYSWFRVQYQMQTEAIRKAYYGRGLKGRMGDLASYVFYVLVAQSVAEGLLRGDLPDDEDDPLLVSWAKWTAKRATVATLSTLPMVRDATSFVDNNFGYRVSPAASAFESVYRLGESAKKFLSDPDDEWTDAVDLIEPAATVAGYYYGVPNRKMIQLAEAFLMWVNEDEAIPWAYLVLGSGFKPKDE